MLLQAKSQTLLYLKSLLLFQNESNVSFSSSCLHEGLIKNSALTTCTLLLWIQLCHPRQLLCSPLLSCSWVPGSSTILQVFTHFCVQYFTTFLSCPSVGICVVNSFLVLHCLFEALCAGVLGILHYSTLLFPKLSSLLICHCLQSFICQKSCC